MTVIHKPFLSFDFKMTGMPIGEIDRNVRRFTTDTELLKTIGTSSASTSAKNATKQAKLLFNKLKASGIEGEIARNLYNGQIKLMLRDTSAVKSAVIRGKLLSSEFSSLPVEQFSGIQPTVNIVGGSLFGGPTQQCTTGFNVFQSASGVYGITTAGHCDNQGNIGGNYPNGGLANTIFAGEWGSSGIDLQWSYVVGSTHNVLPKFQNGTTQVNVTGALNDYPGMFLCKYGQATSITCGYVDPYQYTDSYGDFPRVNRRPGFPIMNNFGDSGGPVYTGGSAVGTVHGKDAAGNLYYTAYRAWIPAGVNIGIICAC